MSVSLRFSRYSVTSRWSSSKQVIEQLHTKAVYLTDGLGMQLAIQLSYIIQLHYIYILSSTWASSAGFCSAAVGFFLGVGAMLLGSDSKKKNREITRIGWGITIYLL